LAAVAIPGHLHQSLLVVSAVVLLVVFLVMNMVDVAEDLQEFSVILLFNQMHF
jgi:hypothetical protein